MSKYDYPNWHEIKDLASLYHEDEWDGARVVVWDPIRRREYKISFSGSTRPEYKKPGEIHFMIWPEKYTWRDKVRWALNIRYIRIKSFFRKHKML